MPPVFLPDEIPPGERSIETPVELLLPPSLPAVQGPSAKRATVLLRPHNLRSQLLNQAWVLENFLENLLL